MGADSVVSFSDYAGGYWDIFTKRRFRRVSPVFNHRLHLADRDSSEADGGVELLFTHLSNRIGI